MKMTRESATNATNRRNRRRGLARLAMLPVLIAVCYPWAAAQSAGLFVANVGQQPAEVRYELVAGAMPVWVTDRAIWLAVTSDNTRHGLAHGVYLRIEVLDATASLALEPKVDSGTLVSLYRGRKSSGWHPRLAGWRTLHLGEIADGRTLRLTTVGERLVLEVGGTGDRPLRLRITGASIVAGVWDSETVVTDSGPLALPLTVTGAPLEFHGQGPDGRPAIGHVPARAPTTMSTSGQPESALELVYGTYIGSTAYDEAEAVGPVVDGSLYLAGHNQSLDFPAQPGPFATEHLVNAYMARFDTTGGGAGYVTVFVGTDLLEGEQFVYDIAVDDGDNLYATGSINTADFPVTEDAYQSVYGGSVDAFLMRLNPDGTLVYSSFLGGNDFDTGYGIALNAAGQIHVTGGTWSTNFPTTPDAVSQTNNGERDAFLVRLDPAAANLDYGSYIGGNSQEQAEDLALAGPDVAHIVGWTRSDNLTSAMPRTPASSPFDAFAARIDLSGATSGYLSLIGGADEDRAFGVAVDPGGRAVVVGRTGSDDFPVTPGAFDTTYGGGTCDFAPCPDAFATKLTLDGTGIVWSGFVGGGDWDEARAVAPDGHGGFYLVGETRSVDFETTTDAFDAVLDGPSDAFVARISPAGDLVTYATYFGGSEEDDASAIATHPDGRVHVGGRTRSADFPTTPDAFDTTLTGDYDAFGIELTLPITEPMRVARIVLQPRTFGATNIVLGIVVLRDSQGNPVPDATVDITWTLPGSQTVAQSAISNASGFAILWTVDIGSGIYTLDIDGVTADGYRFLPGFSDLSEEITLP